MGELTNKVWHGESVFLRAIKHTMLLVLAIPLFSHGNPLPNPTLVTYTFSGELYLAGYPWTLLGPYSGSIGIDANTPLRCNGGNPDSGCWPDYFSQAIITFVLGDQTWSRNAESGPCRFSVWIINS